MSPVEQSMGRRRITGKLGESDSRTESFDLRLFPDCHAAEPLSHSNALKGWL